ncbi:hypothetical protein [Methylobacterium indicum]|uniref:hypothetical protein n=1 Tax=Methylobacterium indicum TaxID=1775910 RepID=UPI002434D548|nr:hypothetical protein [Methylobacterium indicum]
MLAAQLVDEIPEGQGLHLAGHGPGPRAPVPVDDLVARRRIEAADRRLDQEFEGATGHRDGALPVDLRPDQRLQLLTRGHIRITSHRPGRGGPAPHPSAGLSLM